MINWLKEKLGIPVIKRELNFALVRIDRLEKSTRQDKRPMRYEQIERARKRRYKRAA